MPRAEQRQAQRVGDHQKGRGIHIAPLRIRLAAPGVGGSDGLEDGPEADDEHHFLGWHSHLGTSQPKPDQKQQREQTERRKRGQHDPRPGQRPAQVKEEIGDGMRLQSPVVRDLDWERETEPHQDQARSQGRPIPFPGAGRTSILSVTRAQTEAGARKPDPMVKREQQAVSTPQLHGRLPGL